MHSKKIALGLFLLACFWMLTGSVQTRIAATEYKANSAENTQSVVIQTQTSHAKSIVKTLALTGHVEPFRTVTLKAETEGRVMGTPGERGLRVNAEDVIVELTMNDRSARLKQAETALRQAQSDWQANLKLQQKGLHAKTSVLRFAAQVAEAETAVAQIRQEINQTHIKAPFAGILDQRSVVLGDFVDRADPVAVIVDDSQVLIHVEVPQHALASIRPGQSANVKLITDETLTGTVSYIAHLAEAQTRSFKLEIQAPNPAQKRWLGLSATVSLALAEQRAHLISPALLNLDTQGTLYVKALDDAYQVVAYPVEIVRHEIEGFWVSGLPDTVQVITDGQGFYQTGDVLNKAQVRVSEALLAHQEPRQ